MHMQQDYVFKQKLLGSGAAKSSRFEFLFVLGIFSIYLLLFFLLGAKYYVVPMLILFITAFLSLTTASLIYALLYLMLTYVIAAIIFFIIGLDFLALSLIFIYVGAIAILFIFVIMTLSPDHNAVGYTKFNFFDKFFLLLYSLFIFSATFLFVYVGTPVRAFYRWAEFNSVQSYIHTIKTPNDNLTQIGLLLYGIHTYAFYIVVLLLFLGFLAPIVLTIDENAKDRIPDSKIYEIKQETTRNTDIHHVLGTTYLSVMFTNYNYNNIIIQSPLELFESNVTGWLGLEISDGALCAILAFVFSYVSSVIFTYEVIIEQDAWDFANDELTDSLDELIADNIGDDDDDELVMVIQFVFQSILFSNLTNIMPLSDVTSSSLMFTISMAATCFIALNLNGLFIHSYSMINLFLPHGVPVFLKPMLFIIEIISYFARLFSLGIRLFANMMAGHILIAILFTFFSIMLTNIGTGTIASVILFFVILSIYVLELIISYLQAYVFGMLVTLYYGDVINLSHG